MARSLMTQSRHRGASGHRRKALASPFRDISCPDMLPGLRGEQERRVSARISSMISKRIRQALRRNPRDQTWKQIDRIPIPLSAGRIWLVGEDGNVRRAIAWTWPILKRREPHKYRWWMNRISHAREPTPEALTALAALRRAAND